MKKTTFKWERLGNGDLMAGIPVLYYTIVHEGGHHLLIRHQGYKLLAISYQKNLKSIKSVARKDFNKHVRQT